MIEHTKHTAQTAKAKFGLLNAIATMAIALEDMEKSKLADNLLD